MATATAEPVVTMEPEPTEDDRFGIYIIERGSDPRRLAQTSLSGIGLCIHTLRFPQDGEKAQITADDRVGVLDLVERHWLINPYARGR